MSKIYDPEFARRYVALNERIGVPAETSVLAVAKENGKETEMRAALAQLKGGSGYRKSGRSLVDILDEVCTARTRLVPYSGIPKVYSFDENYLAVENLQCVDVEGNVFEKHDMIYVRKDIERDEEGKPMNFTLYQAEANLESKGMFMLSSAGSCCLVAELFQYKDDPEVKKVLMQYKDHGVGYGWHAQNTMIDYNAQKMIHYPVDANFPNNGGTSNINASHRRIELPFEKVKKNGLFARNNVLRNKTIEEGLQDPLVAPFVRQFTGLADPSILIQIGQYFGKPAKVWFPTNPVKVEDCTETRAAWFGCGSYLGLVGDGDLGSSSAVRGVRGSAP